MNYKKSKWGTSKVWGVMKVKYLPTGEIKEFEIGIKRMSYNNELVIGNSWGYDGGNPTDLNHPDNYAIISIRKKRTQKVLIDEL